MHFAVPKALVEAEPRPLDKCDEPVDRMVIVMVDLLLAGAADNRRTDGGWLEVEAYDVPLDDLGAYRHSETYQN